MVDNGFEKSGFALKVIVERGFGEVNGVEDFLDASSSVTFSGEE